MPEKTAVEQLAEIELELKKVQLEDAKQKAELTKHQVAEFAMKKEARSADWGGRQATLDNQTRSRKNLQARCAHRQGGKGVEEMYSSTEARRSVAKFVLPTGDMFVRCLRCKREWHAPDPNLFQKSGKPVQRKDFTSEGSFQKAIKQGVDLEAYKAARAEYEDVCSWDNGGQQVGNFGFQITATREGVNVAREKTTEMTKGARENAL